MEKYSVNIELKNFNKVDILDGNLISRGNQVVILLNEESNNRLNDYYSGIRQVIKQGNKVVIILEANLSAIRKQISLMAVSCGCYDIYAIESDKKADKLTEDYVNELLERTATKEEIVNFISSDVAAYDEIGEFMLNLLDKASNYDSDNMLDYIADNSQIMQEFSSVMDYMKTIVDDYNSGKLQNEIEEYRTELSRTKSELDSKIDIVTDVTKNLRNAEDEVRSLNIRIKETEQVFNSRDNSIVAKYVPIKVSRIPGVKVERIFYFKEISYVKYVNTFVKQLKKCIGIMTEKTVRLVIYDNPEDYISIYYPLQVVDGQKYNQNHSILNCNGDGSFKDILITEPNMAISEALLKVDCDVVIVYDRMKKKENIYEGELVKVFDIIGSSFQIAQVDKSRPSKIDRSRLITNVGSDNKALYISGIDNYKASGESAKTSTYMRLRCDGYKDPLMATVIKSSGLVIRSE